MHPSDVGPPGLFATSLRPTQPPRPTHPPAHASVSAESWGMAQKRKASSFAQEMERDDTAESSTGFSLGVIEDARYFHAGRDADCRGLVDNSDPDASAANANGN